MAFTIQSNTETQGSTRQSLNETGPE